jgi:hypothetical protein
MLDICRKYLAHYAVCPYTIHINDIKCKKLCTALQVVCNIDQKILVVAIQMAHVKTNVLMPLEGSSTAFKNRNGLGSRGVCVFSTFTGSTDGDVKYLGYFSNRHT